MGTNNLALSLSEWIENTLKSERTERMKEMEESKELRLDQLILKLKTRCQDERFSSGENIAESLTTMQTSLTVNLYPQNFSIGNNSTLYAYDRHTINFIEMINSNKISLDILELLRDSPSFYNEGCLMLELKDFRDKASVTYPSTKRVLLRPTYETIVHDINILCNNSKERVFSDFDKINIEASLLLHTSKPLCLDPSPNVFFISSIIGYNKFKNNVKISKKKRKRILASSINEKPFQSPLRHQSNNSDSQKNEKIDHSDNQNNKENNKSPLINNSNNNNKSIPLYQFLSQRQNTPLIPKESSGKKKK